MYSAPASAWPDQRVQSKRVILTSLPNAQLALGCAAQCDHRATQRAHINRLSSCLTFSLGARCCSVCGAPAAAMLQLVLLALARLTAAQYLDQSEWAAVATSEQNGEFETGLASFSIDGDNSTWWITPVRMSARNLNALDLRAACKPASCAACRSALACKGAVGQI